MGEWGVFGHLQVEQHNRHVQHSFIQRMAGAFSNMQHCIQQQEAQHRSILSNYSQAVGKASLKLCSIDGGMTFWL